MKTVTFNLKSFRKKAYYEDSQALMKGQSRGWMNCYKAKVSNGMPAQEAIFTCMEEYQKGKDSDWSFKYASKTKK